MINNYQEYFFLKHFCLKVYRVNTGVIGSKNIGFVKFQSIDDAIFVKKLMNNQILFKSIVKIGFVNNGRIKTCSSFENEIFKTKQRDRIGKKLMLNKL